jgi:hypothetical protein
MSDQLLVTKMADNALYQLYRASIMHPASFNNYRGVFIEKEVEVSGYGIRVTVEFGQESIHYDSGVLSPLSYKVNALFHQICRQKLDDVEQIRDMIWSEYEDWCRNQYGNPFGKIANQKLRKQVNKILYQSP